MSILNIILAVLALWAAPYLAGNGVCEVLKIDKTIPRLYLMGLAAIWAFCQFITVPIVLFRGSFLIVVILLSAWILVLCGYGVFKRNFPAVPKRKKTRGEQAAVLITGGIVAILLTAAFLGQHTDADDARFVVNAVDIVRTNKMFLTNPATGEALAENVFAVWKWELCKDVTSPWAVYMAYCGKITGLSPSVIAHTFFPPMLLTAILGVWWMFSKEFFGEDFLHRCIFLDLLILLHVYGYFSVYSAETFTMIRLWQGKALVAGLGIPAMFLICMWIYKNNKAGDYISIALFNIALCLMSGMGLIIGALMLGCFGLVYGISKKSWRITLYLWLIILPNFVYYLIYYFLKR